MNLYTRIAAVNVCISRSAGVEFDKSVAIAGETIAAVAEVGRAMRPERFAHRAVGVVDGHDIELKLCHWIKRKRIPTFSSQYQSVAALQGAAPRFSLMPAASWANIQPLINGHARRPW